MIVMCASVELERRHYPELFNHPGEMVAPTTTKQTCAGRKHIPHGYGDDHDFVPHGRYVREEHVERYCLSLHATQYEQNMFIEIFQQSDFDEIYFIICLSNKGSFSVSSFPTFSTMGTPRCMVSCPISHNCH